MTITLDIPPELEASLVAEAQARGLSLETYVKELLQQAVRARLTADSARRMSYEEWERNFEAFIDSFPQQPLLSDHAVNRESIYTREDSPR